MQIFVKICPQVSTTYRVLK